VASRRVRTRSRGDRESQLLGDSSTMDSAASHAARALAASIGDGSNDSMECDETNKI
jgi:hypothetical protein